ncbi:MAG: hypothetical protein KBA46_02725 [Candidatus Omnitrophica bacterium]|nr:hypothetical protein [Candidatus Omnitrophota bacterium]
MKKACFILFLVYSILCMRSFLYSQELVATYREFPVYPPEQISQIKNKELMDFSTTLRTRGEYVALIKEKGGDIRDFNAEGLTELGDSQQYVEKNASVLGWKLIESTFLRDGGSPVEKYIKIDSMVRVVTVCFLNPGIIGKFSNGSVVPNVWTVNDKWGTISYFFEEYPLPIPYEGFPFLVSRIEDLQKEVSPEAIIFKDASKSSYCSPDPVRDFLLMHYGWNEVLQPNAQDKCTRFFEKEGKIVGICGQHYYFYKQSPFSRASQVP